MASITSPLENSLDTWARGGASMVEQENKKKRRITVKDILYQLSDLIESLFDLVYTLFGFLALSNP